MHVHQHHSPTGEIDSIKTGLASGHQITPKMCSTHHQHKNLCVQIVFLFVSSVYFCILPPHTILVSWFNWFVFFIHSTQRFAFCSQTKLLISCSRRCYRQPHKWGWESLKHAIKMACLHASSKKNDGYTKPTFKMLGKWLYILNCILFMNFFFCPPKRLELMKIMFIHD